MKQETMSSAAFRDSGLDLRTSKDKSGRVDYKAELLRQIKEVGLSAPTPEYQFHASRRWRMDFAFIEQKIGIEYQGGLFSREASHSSINGILRDIEKIIEAQLMGWVVIPVTPNTVKDGRAIWYIQRAMEMRK